ncbi:MAG: nucleotidyltransferase family protein [Lachnospiraceae bacterium]|jgi:hypothetical protein|nr:nucleotidyltransferase family protein [Lachnospiraceae bacterium]
MQECSMHKSNGMFNLNVDKEDTVISDPRSVFWGRQRYNGLIEDIGETLQIYPYALVKGDVLSNMAYGKSGVRKFSDIDILLPRQVIRQFESSLVAKGYKTGFSPLEYRNQRVLCLSASHQLMPYRKMIKGLNLEIDLNFDIFWGEYTGKRIDITDFLSDTIEIGIYGCRVRTLPPLKAMIQLILHHYKEMNSIYLLAIHNCMKHSMFRDIYYLWKNNKDAIALDKFYNMVSSYEIIPFAYYVLYFTNWIFKDSKLQKYVEALKTPEGVNLLDWYGLAENEKRPWKVDISTRLETENLYELIKDDLTEEDVEKLERNRRIFG